MLTEHDALVEQSLIDAATMAYQETTDCGCNEDGIRAVIKEVRTTDAARIAALETHLNRLIIAVIEFGPHSGFHDQAIEARAFLNESNTNDR